MSKPIRIAQCLPWYAGVDRDCVADALAFQHYLGRLQERAWWMKRKFDACVEWWPDPPAMAPGFPAAELPDKLEGDVEFDFGLSAQIACSLPGLARERAVDFALDWGADYIFFYDSDMRFTPDVFLRLLAADKPVVGALAFTGRVPITPVIYTFGDSYRQDAAGLHADVHPIMDYKRDALIQVDAIGFGVVMIQAGVFRSIPKPWFNSPGVGEDILFCIRCKQFGIPVWVDTAAKTQHKPTFPVDWHDEAEYDRRLERDKK